MDSKRLIVGVIVGTIALYFLGELIWTVLFSGFFEANRGSATGVDREAPLLWSAIVCNIPYALAICLALARSRAPTNLVTGILVGALAGALIWGTADFTHYAFANLRNLNATIADTLLEAVRGGVTGGILAILGGLMSGKPAAN